MLLTKHDSVIITAGAVNYDAEISPFKAEITPSINYTDFSSLLDWCRYFSYTDYGYKDFRNLLISTYVGSWGTITDDEKKALIQHYVYLSTETKANLDLLYTQTERDDYQKEVMELLDATCDAAIRRSNVSGSTKFFDHQTDDAGTLNIVEIKTDVEIA